MPKIEKIAKIRIRHAGLDPASRCLKELGYGFRPKRKIQLLTF